VGIDPVANHRDRSLRRSTPRNMGADRQAEVVIDKLEDHTLPTTCQHLLGPVELRTCNALFHIEALQPDGS